MNKTEMKEKAQDIILGGIAGELSRMCENIEDLEHHEHDMTEQRQIFALVQSQGLRVAKLFNVHSYPGVIHEEKAVPYFTEPCSA